MAEGAKRAVRTVAPPAGGLGAQFKAAPKLSGPKAARARRDEWLAEIASTKTGKAIRQRLTTAKAGKLSDIIAAIAEASPYLWDLVRAEPDRFLGLLDAEPEARFAALIAEVQRGASADTDADIMRALRRGKAEAALLIALTDIGGVWPVERVTRALTEFADAALGAAVRYLLRGAAATGKLKPPDAANPEQGSGYVVLAMGKMGAFELNYSSDIDLIVLYDPDAPALAGSIEPGALFVRLTRNLVKLMQERTADGYVFRTDLRLRPDPASTQIAISLVSALNYYESTGQNWERAAMIKARPCAGDLAVGEQFLKEVAPFVWRKYLDYGAVADVHAMKRQMAAYKGHDEIAIEGHNIKLGRGGIREIEFFVQTQQLIAGGRHRELRERQTLVTLEDLAQGGWISREAADDLAAAYRFLRGVEHRLQMVADEQTHTLPAEREGLERFARFLGHADRDAFAAALLDHLRKVQRHYARLFEDAPAAEASRRALAFPADKDDTETLDKLAAMGFRRPLEVSQSVRRWLAGEYRSLKSEFARAHLAELVPVLIDQLARSENPDQALIALDRFLAGLHGGARLLSLLRRNPDFVALLALVLGNAPRLADILARYPHVMDALIEPSFFGALPDADKLTAELSATLAQASSYEDVLDRARQFGQEHMFLIGARILSGTVSAEQAGESFARLADVLIRAVHRAVEDHFVTAHGRLKGQQSVILALGKLGGREMTASSDLDLIIVYDFDEGHPQSSGARPLYGGQYFARITQRLVSALAAPTNYGALYHVDMRLRPSGRSGPVATMIGSFESYQENEAWTWEHLALTRARVVSGPTAFAARVEKVIQDVLRRPRDPETIAGDVVEMRTAIATEKGDGERWNLKYVAGGLIDLEFIAQYLQLVHAAEKPEILDTATARALDKAARLGVLAPEDADVLRPAVRLYQNLTQILRLCLSGPFDPKSAGPGLLSLLARAADVPDFTTLEAHLAETQGRVRASFTRILGRAP
ncbi:MAG: bifunctional [glutamine synthetase] adenylyltransferase/[glutamine synthetase]-adenylyl-L-tyrosine phosphorylase [Alphaproteobacteria bacterium]|nr:MAG: bifunctional [glutamine synthetase] adenylyltransferase/[glutamine synthetase]-adenylyl-L-tyrosine phosphorylase [Alphaproteobacteria bacterium]